MEDLSNQTVDIDVERLRTDVEISKRKKNFYDRLSKAVPIIALVIFTLMMILYFFILTKKNPIILGIGVFYLAIGIVYPIFNFGKSIDTEIETIENEIALKLTGTNSIEQRAERLFKSHEIGLRRYYDQLLRHNSGVFIVGVFCILIGFVFIGISIYVVFTKHLELELDEKILVAILGTTSGILTNFVAIIYLKIFSETSNSFTTFHNKLVSTNHLHFVNFLVSKIDEKEKRHETLKDICTKITEKI